MSSTFFCSTSIKTTRDDQFPEPGTQCRDQGQRSFLLIVIIIPFLVLLVHYQHWQLVRNNTIMTIQSLSKEQKRLLLEYLEEQSLPRSSINLLSITNLHSHVFGYPGSDLRRAFQKYWQKKKSLPIEKYVSNLYYLGVQPSPATMVQLFKKDKEADIVSDGDHDDLVAAMNGMAIRNKHDDNEEEEDDYSTTTDGDSPTETMSPPPVPFSLPSTSNKSSHAPSSYFSPSAAGSSAFKKKSPYNLRSGAKARTSLSSTNTSGGGSSSSIKGKEKVYIGKGTEKEPYVIHVNVDKPERNGSFQVIQVANMGLGNHAYFGFEIALSIAPPDVAKYTMRVPNSLPLVFKGAETRALLCEGPSQDFWLKDVARLNKARTKKCAYAEDAYGDVAKAIAFNDNQEKDPRDKIFHLLVFPPHVELDNRVFSNQDPSWVKGDVIGMRSPPEENILDKEIIGLVIVWRIAHAHGKKRIGEKPDLVADPKSISFV